MPSTEVARSFLVKGRIGAKFILQVINNPSSSSDMTKYYNFTSNTFTAGHNSKDNNLKVTLTSSSYRGNILFPSGGGSYVVKLLPENGAVTKNMSNIITRNIEKQTGTATITFAPATTNTANYQTLPTVTSAGSISDTAQVDYSWLVKNASTDAGGFGLKYTLSSDIEIDDTFFYYQTTHAISTNTQGDGEDSNEITVADTTGLSIGMQLYYHKATTAPATKDGTAVTDLTVTITNITTLDDNSGTVTFNTEVAFEDGETMTLRAYGVNNIEKATGILLNINIVNFSAKKLTKTLRTDVSASQTIALTDTHGISGGNTISYTGLGVDNSANNRVNVVTPDCPDLSSSGALDNDGQMTVELAQTLEQGTVLTFIDIFNEVTFSSSLTVLKYPTGNKTINLDLDKILTPGVSGS